MFASWEIVTAGLAMNAHCRSCTSTIQTVHRVWEEFFDRIGFLGTENQKDGCGDEPSPSNFGDDPSRSGAAQDPPRPAWLPALPENQPQKQKFLFVVRHAESRWNEHLGKVKQGTITKFVDGAWEATKEYVEGKTDHPLTEIGIDQATQLREKITQSYHDTTATSNSSKESDRKWYEKLFSEPVPIYCSPMRRAVQTAHLAMPAIKDWAQRIVLCADAREVKKTPFDIDCVGSGKGIDIVHMAMTEYKLFAGLDKRVDTSECEEEWWSKEIDDAEQIQARLQALVNRVLNTDCHGTSIVVTHSNLIRELVTHLGSKEWKHDLGHLRQAKDKKLQNCGMLGLRCVFVEQNWVIVEASLMFDSKFES